MSNSPASFSHHALLIGIDDYAKKPLRGCVRDVLRIQQHLEDVFQHNVRTYVLTASVTESPTSFHVTERPEHRPTRPNVVDLLNQITEQAREGTFVYIHFSGHGTARRPPHNKSPNAEFANRSTGDLALNLLKDGSAEVDYLHGSILASSLKAMVDKKLIVTLVLDCCFSGSVMRNDASVRYLDYSPQADATHSTSLMQSFGSREAARGSSYRKASLYPSWLVNPDGYTIITACGPTETAKEIRIHGHVHGVLSYHLFDIFETFGGIGGKQHHVYQFMRARFRDGREKSLHNQTPMLYGNKELYFFGRTNPHIGPAPFPIIQHQNGSFKLEAGQAHGVCEGDKFAVRTIGSSGAGASGPRINNGHSAVAEIISVGALTSIVRLSENSFTSDTTLVATPITSLSLRRFPIRLVLDSRYAETWATALGAHQSLYTYNAGEKSEEQQYSFTVAMIGPESYEVQDEKDSRLLCLPTSSTGSDGSIAQILESVEHLTRYELVKSLRNGSFGLSSKEFRNSFRVHIIMPEGSEVEPGCRQARQQQQICSHQECLIEVDDGTSLLLRVENKNEGGFDFCAHVYNMGPSWEIENILRADYDVIPPPKSNISHEFRPGTTGIWGKRMTMTAPLMGKDKDTKHCDDIVRVLLTSQPTSFLSLELAELGEGKERRGFDQHRAPGTYSPFEDWVALNFRIRTRLERP